MTVLASRLEALVMARARTAGKPPSLGDLVAPLARFAPAELTPAAWREQLVGAVGALRASGVLDAEHRLPDDAALVQRLGKLAARTWRECADRVLPGLGLGIAVDDGKARAKLAGRDAWAAAIVGRALGLWVEGPPPSLAAVCDALAWRELGLAGKPQRCPAAIRALFVQRQLGSEPGAADRLVRVLAAREVGAPRPEGKALCDALVRRWLAGRAIGQAPAEARRSFAGAALAAAGAAQHGRFGDRKVFVSAVWDQLRQEPAWSALTLDELKQRLLAAHRAGGVTLARADLVAAMDPDLVAASEIAADGASFHFLVVEPAA